jgi:sugar/nucleoside kinase (ribokinase family)
VPSGYIGKIGDDDYGRFFKEDMLKNGIRTKLQFSKTATGLATALISPDSERTFATYLGAAVELGPDDINKEILDDYDYFYIEGYLVFNYDLMSKILAVAGDSNMKTVIDLASYNVVEANRDYLLENIEKYIDIVFANEEEAKALTGKEPEEALDIIAEKTEIAVVKIGKDGSMIRKGEEKVKVVGLNVNAIDTTGAGDLYAAGFLFGLLNGYSLELCGKVASLVAANVVEVLGAKMDNERWETIKRGIKNIINV